MTILLLFIATGPHRNCFMNHCKLMKSLWMHMAWHRRMEYQICFRTERRTWNLI